MQQKITPFLWFDGKTEEAVNFYVSIFKKSKIVSMMPLGGGPDPKAMIATFEIEGQQFMALDGGPMYKFTPAISMFVSCKTQGEVDFLWEKLTANGGAEEMCGWLRDKYGVSWQIIPEEFVQMMSDPNGTPEQKGAMMQAMLQMRKFDIKKLKAAYKKG